MAVDGRRFRLRRAKRERALGHEGHAERVPLEALLARGGWVCRLLPHLSRRSAMRADGRTPRRFIEGESGPAKAAKHLQDRTSRAISGVIREINASVGRHVGGAP